jgi:4-hydroxybenzoate polyprenyltransferase
MNISERLHLYIQLARLHRPIGILLLLWPTLWAVWISSGGRPSWHIVFIFTLGTVLMRSAGCVINDYADRDIDKHVQRTKDRPLTSGKVSAREALLLSAALAIISFLLVLPLNNLTLFLSVPAVFLAASYPFTKRFFAIPQAYLGFAFGFGIPMAFAATLNGIPPVAWVLLLANIFWAIAYDTEYAMVDRNDDIHLGIHSSALFFGKFDVIAVMICYGVTLTLLALAGLMFGAGLPYFVGLIAAEGIALYHYNLIKGRNREKCFAAFLHNNWLGATVFVGLVADSIAK